MGLRYFWDLLAQRERVEAFRAAIAAVVRPGDVVLEVGTGLGTFAFFAARAGARRVYAVDADPVLHVAQALAAENGLADQVTFVRGRFPDVEIPERADVVIFEDFPARVVNARVAGVYDALHARFAASDARWVPRAVHRMVVPVGGETLRRFLWPLGPDDAAYGLTWRAARPWLEEEPQYPPEGFEALGGAQRLDTVPLDRPGSAWPTESVVRLPVAADGTIEGLVLWGDLDLAEGNVLSNAPGAAAASWGRVLLPIAPPLPVTPATALIARIRHDGTGGWLGWEVTAGGERRTGHELAGRPADREDLLAGSPEAVPRLARRGVAARAVLGRVSGRRSLAAVAGILGETYPWMDEGDAVQLAAALLDGLVSWHAPAEVET